jgi:hypothetical protein
MHPPQQDRQRTRPFRHGHQIDGVRHQAPRQQPDFGIVQILPRQDAALIPWHLISRVGLETENSPRWQGRLPVWPHSPTARFRPSPSPGRPLPPFPPSPLPEFCEHFALTMWGSLSGCAGLSAPPGLPGATTLGRLRIILRVPHAKWGGHPCPRGTLSPAMPSWPAFWPYSRLPDAVAPALGSVVPSPPG